MSDDESSIIKESLRFVIEVALIVGIIVGIPFLISGIWPPFVSVVSDSMDPNIERGDMILVVEHDRFTDEGGIYGIQPKYQTDSEKFDEDGDVIVFYPDGDETEVPVIHRAVYYAEEEEDWTGEVNEEFLSSTDCNIISNCPAPNEGFITHGDANPNYDQDAGISEPVKVDWVVGKGEYRIPFVGWIRLFFDTITGII